MPAPINDNFASATAISTSLPQSITGLTSVDTTDEVGEPAPYFGLFGTDTAHCVWYTFTPNHTATYRISMENIAYATGSQPKASTLGIYTGAAVNALTPVEMLFGDSSKDSQVIRVVLTNGVTYYIQAGHPHFPGESANDHSITFDLNVSEVISPGTPPANDDIEDAEDLGLNPNGTFSGSNIDATYQAFEGAGSYDQPSVWYKFSIDFTGTQSMILSKTGSDPDWEPYAEIYENNGESLPPSNINDLVFYNYLGDNISPPGGVAQTDVDWVPGDYYMAVTNWNFDGSWDDFEIEFTTPVTTPDNDNFFDRVILPYSYKVCTTGTTSGATTEPFNSEPHTYPGNINPPYPSVWYEWTPPNYNNEPMDYQIDLAGSAATSLYLEIFTGASLSSLTQIDYDHNSGPGGKPEITLSTNGDINYKIRVSSPVTDWGTFNLNITAQPGGSPPANDDFANAITMTGYSDSESGTTVGATAECGEPGWGVGWFTTPETTNTVWYKWTPPQTGRVRFSLDSGSGSSTALYIARGTSLSNLVEVQWRVLFSSGSPEFDYVTVEGGVQYYLIVAGAGGKEDTFTMSFYMENVAIPANNDPANATALTFTNGIHTITDNTQGSYFDTVGPVAGDFVTDPQRLSSVWYKITSDSYGSINLEITNDVVYNSDSAYDAFITLWRGDNIATATAVTSSAHEGGLPLTAFIDKNETYWVSIESYYWSTSLSWDYTFQLQSTPEDGTSPSTGNGVGDFDSTTGTFVADDIDGVFVASGGVGYGTINFSDGHYPYGWWTRFEVESTSGDYLYRFGQTQQFIEIFRATREDDTYESICVLGHSNGIQTLAYYQDGALRYDTGHAVWGANAYGSSSKVRIEVGQNGVTIDGVNFFIPTDEGFVDTTDNQFTQFDFGIITYPGVGTAVIDLDPEWNIRISDLTIHDNPEIGVMGPADPNNKEITSFLGWTTGSVVSHSSYDYQFGLLGDTGGGFVHNPPEVVVSAAEYSNGYSLRCSTEGTSGDALYPCGIGIIVTQPTDSQYYDPYGDPAYDSDYNAISFRFYIHDNYPEEPTTFASHTELTDGELEGWNLVVGTDGTLYIRPSQDSDLIPFCFVNVNEWTYIELQEDVHSVPYAVNIWMGNGVFIGRFEATDVTPDSNTPGPRRRNYSLGRVGDAYLITGFFSDIGLDIELRDIATTRAKQHRPLGPTIVQGKYLNGTGEHLYPVHVEGTEPTQTTFSFNGDFSGGTDGAGQPHYWTGYDRHDSAPSGAMKLDYLFSAVSNSTVSVTTDGSGPPGLEGANAMQVVAIDNGCQVAYVFGGGTSPATDQIYPYHYADTISCHFWLKGIAGQTISLEAESGIGGWFPDNYIIMTGDWQYVRLFLSPQNFSGFTHNLTGLLITFNSSHTGDTFLIKDAWFYLNADNNWFTFWQTTDNGATVTEVPYDDEDSWQLINDFPPTIEGDHVYAATDIFRDTVRGSLGDYDTVLPPAVFSSYLEYKFQEFNPSDNPQLFGAKLLMQCKDYAGPTNNRDFNFQGYGGVGPTYVTISNEDGDYRSIGGRKTRVNISAPDETRFGITLRRPPGLGEWNTTKWNTFRLRFGHHHTLFTNSSHIIGDYTNAGVLEGAYVEILTYDRKLAPPHCVRPLDLSRVRFRTYEENDVDENE